MELKTLPQPWNYEPYLSHGITNLTSAMELKTITSAMELKTLPQPWN